MFGTNVVFGIGVLYGSTSGLTKSMRRPHVILGISNEYRPISGIRYLIHYHESSFAGIWERIMRKE